MERRLGGQPGDGPVTEDVSDRLLRLPLYHSLTEDDLARGIEGVIRFDFRL